MKRKTTKACHECNLKKKYESKNVAKNLKTEIFSMRLIGNLILWKLKSRSDGVTVKVTKAMNKGISIPLMKGSTFCSKARPNGAQ